MNATALKARLDSVLRKNAPLERTVYKRVVTRTGGDDLIGRPASVTVADTVLSPQAVCTVLGRTSVPAGYGHSEGFLSPSGKSKVGDDYSILVSVSAISLTELESKTLQLVLKDSAGTSEVLDILDYGKLSAGGAIIGWQIFARSVQRG